MTSWALGNITLFSEIFLDHELIENDLLLNQSYRPAT